MSVAKVRIREDLKRRTQNELDGGSIDLYFSARRAILDYKSLLIDSGLEHGELANSYLYELGRRRDKTVRKFRRALAQATESGDSSAVEHARKVLVRYLVAVLEVAVFIYSGAPSVSHGVKLTRMVAASIGELEVGHFGLLDRLQFRDRVRRELIAQLNTVHDESSFGAHTLLLIDCLLFVDAETSETVLRSFLTRRSRGIEDLDAFGVLTFLRRFQTSEEFSSLRSELLDRARELIDFGLENQEGETERAILLLSLPTFPGATTTRIAKAMGNGYSKATVERMRSAKREPSMFSWNASDHYYERLLLKSAQSVY